MRTRFAVEDEVIQTAVLKNYGISIQKPVFLPNGDISYVYRIIGADGIKYSMKLFDKNTRSGRKGIRYLKFSLPVTWDMYDRGLYQNISYPIPDDHGDFVVDIGPAKIVLFSFREGKTLEESSPFCREVLEKAANGIACIHDLTGQMHFQAMRIEDFDLSFLKGLETNMECLEQIQGERHTYVMQDVIADLGDLSGEMSEEMWPGEKTGVGKETGSGREGGKGSRASREIGSKTYSGKQVRQFTDPAIQALCDAVLPQKETILSFIDRLYRHREQIDYDPYDMVLTYGDPRGKNLLLDSQGDLCFIDWGSARIAPREADLQCFLTEDFDFFLEKYEAACAGPFRPDPNLLGYYVFRTRLSGLADRISGVLHGSPNREQNQSDLEYITHQDVGQWEELDRRIQQI